MLQRFEKSAVAMLWRGLSEKLKKLPACEPVVREAPAKKNHVYLGIAQIAIGPPLKRKSGHFVAQFFCRKWENSLNSNFDFRNEYFDRD